MPSLLSAQVLDEKLKQYCKGKRERDGKIMVDDDEKKEELDDGIIMKAINTVGGKLFWAFMFVQYTVQSFWTKYTDY